MKSYHDSLEFVYRLRGGGVELGLDRVALALRLFGNPQSAFDAFHVAGTNGKGSTAAMLHEILSAGGYRVGRYTSPHLNAFTERIRVADRDITEKEVICLIQEIWSRISEANLSLTFFEFVTVMALLYFSRKHVDVAVVEVGLGGRLDATNLVCSAVSIITSIARDHETFLGSEIRSIAREKAGIIKEQIPVVCGPLPKDAMDVIESVARARTSPLYNWDQDFSVTCDDGGRLGYQGGCWNFEGIDLGLRGGYQRRNAAVAIAAMEVMRERFFVGEGAVRKGLRDVEWPGRLEVVSQDPMIILDGAHNVEGIRTLVSELPAVVGDKKVRLLFGSMSDKDWRTMLLALSEVSSEVILTRVPMDKSAPPSALRQALPQRIPSKIITDPVAALSRLVTDRGKTGVPIVVAGSLYLIGSVRRHALPIPAKPGV